MRLIVPLLLTACAASPEPGKRDAEGPGPISEPLPGQVDQHHARLACVGLDCVVARQVANTVGITPLADGPTFGAPVRAPESVSGWNHPELRADGDGLWMAAGTWGAPHLLRLDPDGAVAGDPLPLDVDWPWGLWPDVSPGEDGRLYVLWSTKTTPWELVLDPDGPVPEPTTWELALTQATVDPPAATPVPGGHVRAWTVKNGFDWEVRLQWLDLDALPDGPVVVAATGSGTSRGARPQLAARTDGTIAVAWRVWPARDAPPEGAFVRVYGPDHEALGPAVRLDADDHGDRPAVVAAGEGWLAAWEQGLPEAVVAAHLTVDGTPLEAPIPVSDAGSVHAGRAAVALRPDGRAWVSWEEVYDKRGDDIVDADVRVRSLPTR